MTLVEEDAVDDAFNRLVNSCIIKDNIGGFSTEFESDFLIRPGNCLRNVATHFSGTSKRHLVDVWMIDECTSGLASTSDDVDDARRKICLLANLGEE
ncbi:unannotated protein [freshwater metagenome]|uniref:Unannotated protein n=1 Tax=freshwater metagenome TaxID=449393 RepID=A0A6J7SLY4_9ZZZZ